MNPDPIAWRDEESAVWFAGLVVGALLIRRCDDCGHHGRPDAVACTACESRTLRWVEAVGTARVVATVATPEQNGGHTIQALVELTEGPWLFVPIIGTYSAPAPGTPLTLTILRPPEGEPIPAFTVAA
ncbi:Zn-ribbon domain-containing OB-fold protein [Streptomyces sp. NPDC001663]|uniref:Zn-ribbon domain-containing OB-fold protein n=1 Tax=Streptomyces sp. NPDC001663 TaxID=3364597 RepID=UPI0036BF8E27